MRGHLIIPGLAVLLSCCSGTYPGGRIAIDLAGYRPEDRKIGFLVGSSAAVVEVRTVEGDSLVYTAAVERSGRRDANTGDDTFAFDFSSVDAPGVYHVLTPGGAIESGPFRIGSGVYEEACVRAIESFYYQRCGIAIDNGAAWKHPPCHLVEPRYLDDTTRARDIHGGWHDAGDYNRFTVTTAVSAAFLLTAYDQRPGRFKDGDLKIPESGNGVPDILDEARWALEWLLRMQGPDGGVYHKASIREWTAEHLPDEETDPQYIFPASSMATGSAAAVAALGARLLRDSDPPFSMRLMQFAIRGWEYLADHPGPVPAGGFVNPPGVTGGEYRDAIDADERLWASAELFRLTGNAVYDRAFLTMYRSPGVADLPPGWMNVGSFALCAYLENPGADPAARREIIARLRAYGNLLAGRVEANGYRCVLNADEFYWGSNAVALGYAFDLVQAGRATGEEKFFRAALDQLHYVLGRNAFGIAFVTGVGDRPVRRPYHQFSILLGAGAPVPGMMVGGPNSSSKLGGRTLSEFPGKCYEDNEKNYFVNETAINYTAPLVYLAGFFSPGRFVRTENRAEEETR